jgi:predicted Zn finger-like uncharacterized protein
VDITCASCRRSYFVPDELVHGRTFRAKCSQCGHAFAVDVGERPGGKGRRAPADSMPVTSASAIPGLAESLSDADLGWLDEAAAEADAAEKEDAYVLLTVQRSRRGSALKLVGGIVVLVAAVAGIGLWLAGRYRLLDGVVGPRAPRAAEGAAGAIHDAGGLALSSRPEPPPDAAPTPAPAPAPVSRRKRARLTVSDRNLLDLLARKQDAAPVGLPDDDEEHAASATSALDPDAAEKVIAQNRRAFDACISKTLRLNPTARLARRATMVVTVQPDGRVSETAIAEEEVARTDLGACLQDTARRMAFPAFDGEPVDVAIPLSLSTAF